MPRLVGFGTFAALPEEQISEKISRRILSGDQGMIVWWSIGAGVHVEPHSHANEQIVWMLKGKMGFQLIFRRTSPLRHQVARFRQVNVDNPCTDHDALEFPDGQVVLLTHLRANQRATVLQLPAQPKTADAARSQTQAEAQSSAADRQRGLRPAHG
jgi:hypothetical protein